MGQIVFSYKPLLINIVHELTHGWHERNDPIVSPEWVRQFRGADYDPSKPITELGMLKEYAKTDRRVEKLKIISPSEKERPVFVFEELERSASSAKRLKLAVFNDDPNKARTIAEAFFWNFEYVPGEIIADDETLFLSNIRKSFYNRGKTTDDFGYVAEDVAVHLSLFSYLINHIKGGEFPMVYDELSRKTIVEYTSRIASEDKLRQRAEFFMELGVLPDNYLDVVDRHYEISIKPRSRVA